MNTHKIFGALLYLFFKKLTIVGNFFHQPFIRLNKVSCGLCAMKRQTHFFFIKRFRHITKRSRLKNVMIIFALFGVTYGKDNRVGIILFNMANR